MVVWLAKCVGSSKLFSNFSLSDFYKWLLASMAKKSKLMSWLGFGKSDKKQAEQNAAQAFFYPPKSSHKYNYSK